MRSAFDDDSNNADDADEFDLERDFPLGDGTAETEGVVACPYCGEENTVSVDPGGGEAQDYVEDCQVCCQPWAVHVEYDGEGRAAVTAMPLDDA